MVEKGVGFNVVAEIGFGKLEHSEVVERKVLVLWTSDGEDVLMWG